MLPVSLRFIIHHCSVRSVCDFGNGIDADARTGLINELRSNEYSRLCISQRHPFDWYLELPHPSGYFT